MFSAKSAPNKASEFSALPDLNRWNGEPTMCVEESNMQQEKRCPRCKHERHKEHIVDFMSKNGQVCKERHNGFARCSYGTARELLKARITLCRCTVCVPQSVGTPSVAELELAQ
jgi:hypothetical protein